MDAANTLCKSLFHWLENRKECAGELEKLAQELEDVPQGSNTTQGVRASVSAAALTSVCPTSTAKEAGVSSSIFNKATELIKEDEKVGTNIQELLRDLKDRCAETQKDRCAETQKDRCGEAPLRAHADELDCEMATLLMWALARRSNTPVPLDFLRGFNRATFFRHMTRGGLTRAKASDYICQAVGLDPSPEITSSLKVSAKEMMKNIKLIGTKAAAKAGSRGAAGFGIVQCDLIETEELVKGNRVTKASKILRDSARKILDGQQKLKEQLDAVQEIIQKLFRMKNLIKDLGEYSPKMTVNGQIIMNYIMGTCRDGTVVSWLQELTHQTEFVNLLRFFLKSLSPILEYLTQPGRDHIDIVFVAHGRIVGRFMPSGVLVPTDNIRDTILYSPWNCRIDANTAFAIAQGTIQPADREFVNMAHCEPNPLPDHWNSMRRSLHNIPGILLAPVTPDERAWALYQQFWMNRMELEERVIIPYLVPECLVNAFGEIPLHMLIFATSVILMLSNKTATVHLAACLGRVRGTPSSSEQRERQERERNKWRTQYAYTNDGTWMSVNMENRNMDPELYRALRSLFDTNL